MAVGGGVSSHGRGGFLEVLLNLESWSSEGLACYGSGGKGHTCCKGHSSSEPCAGFVA